MALPKRRIAAVMQSPPNLVVNIHLMDGDAMPVIRKGNYDLVEVPDEVAIGMARAADGTYAWPVDPPPAATPPAAVTVEGHSYKLARRR